MSIETMKLALAALETCRIRSVSEWSVEDITPKNVTAAIEALRTAIQQAEAQQPATTEPVGFTYQAEIDYADSTGGNGSFWRVPPDLDDEAVPLYTHPAPSEPVVDVRCEGCGYMTHHREHMGCVRAAKQHTHPAPSVPAGYALVPIEPTQAMLNVPTWDFNRFYSPREIWAAMLAAK